MDPKTSAKVTSPDLLAAFAEGMGDAGDAPPDSGAMRIWLVLFVDPDGAESATAYRLDEWDKVFAAVREHLDKGKGHGVAMVVSDTQPDLFDDALNDISQIEQ